MRIAMAGKLYAVGVGPGDPELITIKAVKLLKLMVLHFLLLCPRESGIFLLSGQILQV